MRPSRVVIVVAAAGGLGFGATRLARPAPEPAPVGAPPATAAFEVKDALRPRLERVELAVDPSHGDRIRFRGPTGWSVRGVTSAALFPVVDGRPLLSQGREVHMLQAEDGELDLGVWRRRAGMRGRLWLRFSVRLESDGSTRYATGWAPLDTTSLALGPALVHVPESRAAAIHVRTESGDDVPGAVLLVGPEAIAPGIASAVVVTDERGIARVTGLDPEIASVAALPMGAGPWSERVMGRIEDGRADVVLPVPGSWTFERMQVPRRHLGQAVTMSVIAALPAGATRAWLVSPIVPPGTGRPAEAWCMWPSGLPRPEALDLKIAGGSQVRIPVDARPPP